MPSGRTHDRITLWALPAITALTYSLTQNSTHTLIVAGGYLFSGLMFSPDLDLHSRPFTRWGYLRWIWIPYQKIVNHRSVLSHGILIGTVVRIIYLTGWLGSFALLFWVISYWLGMPWSWAQTTQTLLQSLKQNKGEYLALFIGLELGALIHVLSDATGTLSKRYRRYSLARILNNPKKKSKSVKRKRPPKKLF